MKKIITALLLAIAMFAISSCQKKENIIGGVIFNTNVDLVIKSAAGENLLDPATSGYYKPEAIRTYILQNQKKVEVYMPNLDAPRDFRVIHNEANNEYYLTLFYQHPTVDQEITTTYIQWQANKADTIQMLFAKPNSSTTTVDKVWLNGVLKYDVSGTPVNGGNFRRLITISH